jgi:hypothetical protein
MKKSGDPSYWGVFFARIQFFFWERLAFVRGGGGNENNNNIKFDSTTWTSLLTYNK